MRKYLLVDYGGVVSDPQPLTEKERLVRLSGLDAGTLWGAYWRERGDYDRGWSSSRSYWSSVLHRDVQGPELELFVDADLSSWTHLNHAVLASLQEILQSGVVLGLLSNAPVTIASYLKAAPELIIFDSRRFFSSDLGLAKPDPAIFFAVLGKLGVRPMDTAFIDDDANNVTAARVLGIKAMLFDRLRGIVPECLLCPAHLQGSDFRARPPLTVATVPSRGCGEESSTELRSL